MAGLIERYTKWLHTQWPAGTVEKLPVSGPEGSLERLAALPCRHRVYTHINNTNPMLIEDSPERAQVERAGLRIGVDGMRFTL